MIVIDAAQVSLVSDPVLVVGALRDAFRASRNLPDRLHYDLPGDDGAKLLLMPAWEGRLSIGVKILTVIPSNGERNRPTIDGLYLLLDGLTGSPRAMLSGPALTVVRTAGVCALATSMMARPDASTLLIIGSGSLAPHLVRSYCAVRPIKRVIVWARNVEKAQSVLGQLSDLNVLMEIADNLPAVIGEAEIIACATSSNAPLFCGALVKPGTHIDLIGGFSPEMREGDTELLRRARLVVDTKAAFAECGDLLTPLREGAIRDDAPDLATLVRRPEVGRKAPLEITVFKTVGNALADLAAAQYIVNSYEKAATRGEAIDS